METKDLLPYPKESATDLLKLQTRK